MKRIYFCVSIWLSHTISCSYLPLSIKQLPEKVQKIMYSFLPQKKKNDLLREAIVKKNYDHVHMLLHAGADATIVAKNGVTPLMLAAKNGESRIFELILNKNLENTLKKDRNDQTLLMYAAKGGNINIIKQCLKHGCLMHAVNKVKLNSLWFSVYHGHYQAACFLIDQGASLSDVEGNCFTLMQAAFRSNEKKIMKIFLDFNKEHYSTNYDIQFIVLQDRNLSAFRFLLAYGQVDPFVYHKSSGQTVLTFCALENLSEFLGALFLYFNKQNLYTIKNKKNIDALTLANVSGSYAVSDLISSDKISRNAMQEEARFLINQIVTESYTLCTPASIHDNRLKPQKNIAKMIFNRQIGI